MRDKQCPICLRIQEKAFENLKFTRGGLLIPRAVVKYSIVKFQPPTVNEKLDPPLHNVAPYIMLMRAYLYMINIISHYFTSIGPI